MSSKIIFQIVSPDGRMGTQHLDWQTQSTDLLQRIEETIDHIPMDTTVFVVVDLYSEVRKTKEKKIEEKKDQVRSNETPVKVEFKQDALWSMDKN